LIGLWRNNHNIITQLPRDALQHIEPFGMNTVVIGDENTHE
jgi:hypothetical protein